MHRVWLRRAFAAVFAVVALAVMLPGAAMLVLGYRISPVLTGSMRPAFRPGDAIVTKTVPVRSLHPGMVAVIVPPGETSSYAHRVVTLTPSPAGPIVMTKGDANPAPDSWRARLGQPTVPVVVTTVPAFGRFLLWAHGRRSAAALAVLLGLVLTGAGIRIATATAVGGHPQPRHAT